MAATAPDGQRYIVYNERFISQFKQDSATINAAYAVLAHEVGHHVQNHLLNLTDLNKAKDQECRADYFAGGVLFALCRSLKEAVSALSALPEKVVRDAPLPLCPRVVGQTRLAGTQKVGGTDNPCDRMRTLRTGRLGVEGRAENIRGRINNDKIEFIYDVKALGNKPFKAYILINNEWIIPKPENIEWKDDPTSPGMNKVVTWHYLRDGYTTQMVEKPDSVFGGRPGPQRYPQTHQTLGLRPAHRRRSGRGRSHDSRHKYAGGCRKNVRRLPEVQRSRPGGHHLLYGAEYHPGGLPENDQRHKARTGPVAGLRRRGAARGDRRLAGHQIVPQSAQRLFLLCLFAFDGEQRTKRSF